MEVKWKSKTVHYIKCLPDKPKGRKRLPEDAIRAENPEDTEESEEELEMAKESGDVEFTVAIGDTAEQTKLRKVSASNSSKAGNSSSHTTGSETVESNNRSGSSKQCDIPSSGTSSSEHLRYPSFYLMTQKQMADDLNLGAGSSNRHQGSFIPVSHRIVKTGVTPSSSGSSSFGIRSGMPPPGHGIPQLQSAAASSSSIGINRSALPFGNDALSGKGSSSVFALKSQHQGSGLSNRATSFLGSLVPRMQHLLSSSSSASSSHSSLHSGNSGASASTQGGGAIHIHHSSSKEQKIHPGAGDLVPVHDPLDKQIQNLKLDDELPVGEDGGEDDEESNNRSGSSKQHDIPSSGTSSSEHRRSGRPPHSELKYLTDNFPNQPASYGPLTRSKTKAGVPGKQMADDLNLGAGSSSNELIKCRHCNKMVSVTHPRSVTRHEKKCVHRPPDI